MSWDNNSQLKCEYHRFSCWLLAAGHWIFLNVAQIGLASRQLPEASCQW
jgi:hypothetical protein